MKVRGVSPQLLEDMKEAVCERSSVGSGNEPASPNSMKRIVLFFAMIFERS